MEIKNGLKPLPKDTRDFKLGSVFTPASILAVPLKDFIIGKAGIKDQGPTFRCSGYATAVTLEPWEGVSLSGDYIYAKAKQIENDTSNGANLRSVAKAVLNYGAVEEKDWKELNISDQDIRQWWGLLRYDGLAFQHKQKSYLFLNNSDFDTVLAEIWEHQQRIVVGTTWLSSWTNSPTIYQDGGVEVGGHALSACGQKIINGVRYIAVQNSYGEKIGDHGIQYFSKEMWDKYFPPYGALLFKDLTEMELSLLRETAKMTILEKIIKALQDWIGIISLKKKI